MKPNYRYVLMTDGEIILLSPKVAWKYKLYSAWNIDKALEKRDEEGLPNREVRFARPLEDVEL